METSLLPSPSSASKSLSGFEYVTSVLEPPKPTVASTEQTTLRQNLSSDPARNQLLTAFGTPPDCSGLRAVVIGFTEMANSSVRVAELTTPFRWLQVALQLRNSVEQIMSTPSLNKERVVLGSAISDSNFDGIYRTLLASTRINVRSHVRANLDQLTVMLVMTAAGANIKVSDKIANGLRQCYESLRLERNNSWSNIAKKGTINCLEIQELLSKEQKIVVRDFLLDCHSLLSTEIGLPPHPKSVNTADSEDQFHGNSEAHDGPKKGLSGKNHTKTHAIQDQTVHTPTGPQAIVAPSVSALVRGAQTSSLAAKAGVQYQWDCLITEDLAALTSKLAVIIDNPDDKLSAFATLALLSLTVRANAKAALLTPLQQGAGVDLWIDIKLGSLCWLHAAYTQASRPDVPLDPCDSPDLVNHIPLSQVLTRGLRRHETDGGEKATIADLLGPAFASAGINLSEFNHFLAELGDKAHVAFPTRFANSLGLAFLLLTGSDMAAALCTLHFEIAAPSALYYFSPRSEWVESQCNKVYERLGLEGITPRPIQSQRLGPQKWIDQHFVSNGWNALCTEIEITFIAVKREDAQEVLIAEFNKLVPLCAAAFTIACGGRGSEPSRMNYASIMSADDFFVLDDKLIARTKSARLLPHYPITAAILKILILARQIVSRRLKLRTQTFSSCTEAIFSKFEYQHLNDSSDHSGQHLWIPINADALAVVTKNYFNRPLNFARHLWITSLGEQLVDRFLIRAFSGHGSLFFNAFSPALNVSPNQAMRQLGTVLERTSVSLLGDTGRLQKLASNYRSADRIELQLNLVATTVETGESEYVTSDPLHAIDRQCLIDWCLVKNLRMSNACGTLQTSIDARILLSMLSESGILMLDTALRFVTGAEPLRSVGKVNGVTWSRDHYIHNVWLPLQKPTLALLSIRGEKPPATRSRVIVDAAHILRTIPGFVGWPTDNYQTLQRFMVACERWRRIELPPALCTITTTSVETACLSAHSLHRLCLNQGGAQSISSMQFKNIESSRTPRRKNSDLSDITSALNKWSDNKPRGGELARAQGLKKELNELYSLNSVVFNFAKHVWSLECQAIIDHQPHRNKVSSMATRWSSLHPVLASLNAKTDLEDYESDDWIVFVDAVNRHCIQSMHNKAEKYVLGSGKERSLRARDALQRLFNILSRDGWEISNRVWQELGGATVRVPRLSASSTVILASDIQPIVMAGTNYFKDEPQLGVRLGAKVLSMTSIPQRIEEASCVPIRCVTGSGALTIPKTPFNVDKSNHASRVWPLNTDAKNQLQNLIKSTLLISTNGKWLFRFDDKSMVNDLRVNQTIAELIRWQTGDVDARTHSLRAQAYSNILWPDWQRIASQFLLGNTNAFSCRAWTQSLELSSRWPLAINAMAAAGQGAVDPGYKHYSAAWPIIYAIYLSSTLTELQPSQKWLLDLGLKPNSMRQARLRAESKKFDVWEWMTKDHLFATSVPFFTPALPTNSTALINSNNAASNKSASGFATPQAMRYVALRALGEHPEKSVHLSGVSGSVALQLEKQLPSEEEFDAARKRKKSHCSGVTQNAELRLFESTIGKRIVGWVLGLPDDSLEWIDRVLRRDQNGIRHGIKSVRCAASWQKVIADLPLEFSISARFGKGNHLSFQEETALRRFGPEFKLGDRNRDLGAMPEVMLTPRGEKNSVLARRYTALLHICVLAKKCINRVRAEHE